MTLFQQGNYPVHSSQSLRAEQHVAALPEQHKWSARASVLLKDHVIRATANACVVDVLYHQTL